MVNLKNLSNLIVDFLKDKKDYLTQSERNSLIKSLMTVEQFFNGEEKRTTDLYKVIDNG